MNIWLFIVACALADNLIFGKLCGCVFASGEFGVKGAALTGALTALVTTLSALIVGLFDLFLPAELHMLVMAAVVLVLTQILRGAMKGCCETLEKLYLPVALGSILLGIIAQSDLGLGYGVLSALFCSVGYLFTLVMMAGVRERLAYSKVPAALKGLPISLITAGLMTLTFMGFTGLA